MTISNDVQRFNALQHHRYPYLKALSLSRPVGPSSCGAYEVGLLLSHGTEDLQLRCLGVVDIKLGPVDGMTCMLIGIEDQRDRQFEGMNFRVVEEENGAFEFYCQEFYVESLT